LLGPIFPASQRTTSFRFAAVPGWLLSGQNAPGAWPGLSLKHSVAPSQHTFSHELTDLIAFRLASGFTSHPIPIPATE
jgi:hypothetical protein